MVKTLKECMAIGVKHPQREWVIWLVLGKSMDKSRKLQKLQAEYYGKSPSARELLEPPNERSSARYTSWSFRW